MEARTAVAMASLTRTTMRAWIAVAAALIAGAVYLAITRGDALLIDLAALAQCL